MRYQFAWLLLCLPLGAWAGEPPTEERIAGWIKELGAEDFQTREEAQKHLQGAGQSALKALEFVAEHTDDTETRLRAARMVKELTAGPRIAAAIQALDSDDWERVSKALETLWDELGQERGVKEALTAAARGTDKRAVLAKLFQQHLNQIEKTRESYAKYLEQQSNNELARQQIARALEATENQAKAQLNEACKREVEKRKPQKEKKAPAAEGKTEAVPDPGL